MSRGKRIMFVLARTGKGRPTLQHRLLAGHLDQTACGHYISSWSRAYQSEAILAILCKKRACWEGPEK